MMEKIKINLPPIIIDHIMNCCTSILSSYPSIWIKHHPIFQVLKDSSQCGNISHSSVYKENMGWKGLNVSSNIPRFKEIGVPVKKNKRKIREPTQMLL